MFSHFIQTKVTAIPRKYNKNVLNLAEDLISPSYGSSFGKEGPETGAEKPQMIIAMRWSFVETPLELFLLVSQAHLLAGQQTVQDSRAHA